MDGSRAELISGIYREVSGRKKVYLYSPMVQRYLSEKGKYATGTILLMRMGDFFEALFEDAEVVARVCEITQCALYSSQISIAGFPVYRESEYCPRLLDYNVVIVR